MLNAGERGHKWQSLAQSFHVRKQNRVGEQDMIASKCGGNRWGTAVKMKDVQSSVCCGASMIETPLCCGACTRLAAIRDLVC